MRIIYKITNLINDKFYVGQHYTSADDGYLGSGTILKHAIKKYGKENFKREILEFCKTQNELNEREIYWISYTSAIDLGYNICIGGEGTGSGENNPNYGKPRSNKIKQKISNSHKGEKNYWFNKIFSKRHRYNISKHSKGENNNMYGFIGEKHPVYGRKHTDSEIDRMRNNKNCKNIKIDDIIYRSINCASRILFIPRGTIKNRLKSNNFPNYQYI